MPRQIELRTASEDDVPRIEAWAEAIDAGRFMSRYLPDQSKAVLWDIVIADGVEIGTTWVEGNAGQSNIVSLGILLGQTDMLGKGIGRAVVRKVVAKVQTIVDDVTIQLNVRRSNTRAIACYRKCGFFEIASREKVGVDGALISTITMRFSTEG